MRSPRPEHRARGPPPCYATVSLASWRIGDLRLDQFREESKRLLPAKIASLGRDDVGDSFLRDVQLSPTRHLLEGDGHVHCAGYIRIVELVAVANPFVWRQFEVLAAERVALAGREVRERHLVGATDAGVHAVNLGGESVWREPFDHCIRIEERAIDPLVLGPEDTVKADRARHDCFSFRWLAPGMALGSRTGNLDFDSAFPG